MDTTNGLGAGGAAPSVAQLRQLPAAELAAVGAQSLREHVLAQAVVAHQLHAPLKLATLDSFLGDRRCVRHPTRLVFEIGGMALHQFAQPDLDFRDEAQTGRVIYLRPQLREHPDLIVLAVAYMVPVINYGELVTDELCLEYGATLLGLTVGEYYAQVCALADFVGAPARPMQRIVPEPSRGCEH